MKAGWHTENQATQTTKTHMNTHFSALSKFYSPWNCKNNRPREGDSHQKALTKKQSEKALWYKV